MSKNTWAHRRDPSRNNRITFDGLFRAAPVNPIAKKRGSANKPSPRRSDSRLNSSAATGNQIARLSTEVGGSRNTSMSPAPIFGFSFAIPNRQRHEIRRGAAYWKQNIPTVTDNERRYLITEGRFVKQLGDAGRRGVMDGGGAISGPVGPPAGWSH